MIFETARLALRPLTADDIGCMLEMWADPNVHRFIGGAKTPEETRQKLSDTIEHEKQHGFSRWAVTLKINGEMIGICGPMMRLIAGVNEVELGYAFPQNHWGAGYATEAARASLEHCLNNLGHRRVVAIIHPENDASIRVITKIGMRFERSVEWDRGPVNLYVIEKD